MAEPIPPSAPQEPAQPRWPLILGALTGGFFLVALGLGLGWYLFYRPVVNVAVRLPPPPAPPAPAGPDAAQIKALEDQIEKAKAANRDVEAQIAALKERLRADVCTARNPSGAPPAPGAPSGGQKI